MRSLVTVLLVLLAALPADAAHCETWTTTQWGVYGTPVIEHDGLYVHIECSISAVNGCQRYSLWIHEESNGFTGLQVSTKGQDDTCHGMIAPDTIVF